MSDTVLNGGAVDAVARLAARSETVQQLVFGDYSFTDRQIHRVNIDPKQPTALRFHTLEGFAGYLKAEHLGIKLVHVVSPTRVDAISLLYGEDDHVRTLYAFAEFSPGNPSGFRFNAPSTVEALSIALLTCFEQDVGNVEELRKFLASVRSTEEIGVDDDGVSQTVKARSGIAASLPTPVKPLWYLAPWRTFPEVTQPLSPYLLRFSKSDGMPHAGLYETGNALWVPEAVATIAEYLRTALGEGWTVLG